MILASEAATQAEIIAVGSELLLGQIVDTNSAFIAREFADFMEKGKNPAVGTLAHLGQVDIRIPAKGTDTADAYRMIEPVEAEIRQRLGEAVRKWSGVEIGLATVFEDVPDTTPPVTAVGIAVARGGRRVGREHRLGGDRPSLRIRSATLALDLLRRSLS